MKRIVKITSALVTSLLLVPSTLALQQVAGALVINVPIGGSNSTKYGLINDGKETITVSLRAEGDVSKYLSFPETVTLEPNKIVYVDVEARLPNDYNDGSAISGWLYALQEGKPGQVRINVQMKKNVTILVTGQTASEPVVSSTGLFVFSTNFIVASIVLILIVACGLVCLFKLKGVKR
jgi:hypothetical protein